MTEKKSELHLTFSTPIWTSIIPNYKDVNDKMYKFKVSWPQPTLYLCHPLESLIRCKP